jgi:outer membrane protein assembly factor BamD
MIIKKQASFILVVLSTLGFVSCKVTSITDLSQEDGISRIRKNYQDKEWTEVISEIDEYKTRYPYSKFMIDTDIMQGDAYYQSRKYPEAIAVYDNFIRKNPSDSNVSLAYYRIGKCYDFQAPENNDRDQENSRRALQSYDLFIQNYPTSEFISDAKARRESINRRIAEHDNFVANFYWKQDLYAASLSRYLEILNTYKEYPDLINIAKKRAASCYKELARILKNNPKSDEYVYFKNETPESLIQHAKTIENN